MRWWYLVVSCVAVGWLGIAEAIALPAYGGYAKEVFANLFAVIPSSPFPPVTVTVFQWSCALAFVLLAYRQWARRQFKWMIATMVLSLLYVPFVVYVVHEVIDQRKGAVRLVLKPDAEVKDA